MWGTDGVRVFTVDDGWGWIFTVVEHWSRVLSAGMSASAATASPPCSRSPIGRCRAVWLDSRAAGSGAGLADGSRLPVSVGPLHQPDQVWGIQPSYAFVAEPQTNGVAERFNRTLKEQIHPWSHLPQHRGAAGRRDFVELYNAQMDRRKERLPEFGRSSSSGVARRDLNQARRVRQTCVQGIRVRYMNRSSNMFITPAPTLVSVTSTYVSAEVIMETSRPFALSTISLIPSNSPVGRSSFVNHAMKTHESQ